MLHFKMFGPFGITDPDGCDRRAKLTKSNAILAVLAATPGHRHTRSWFQTLLWGDRQHEQSQSSLRSALSDIRRGLGPYETILKTSNLEIALDPACIRTDMEDRSDPTSTFLEGFDVPHAEGFEDWLRQTRSSFEQHTQMTVRASAPASEPSPTHRVRNLYLATGPGAVSTVTQLKCDALIDGLAKSFEEFGLGGVIDGRFGATDLDAQIMRAQEADCAMLLVAQTVESNAGAMARLKVIDTETGRLFWSKSLVGTNGIDIDDPNTIAVVAEFIDIMAHHVSREISWTNDALPPDLLALAGINQAFKLGAQNFELADTLLKKAHAAEPKAVYLAWRGFLRSFALCELEFSSPEVVIEEGKSFARRAFALDPHNSMVLALSAHVENVMSHSFERGLELSTRALEINRCNPMAWASMGLAASFLGNAEDGRKLTKVGAKLSSGNWYAAQSESWASAASILASDVEGALSHAERSHRKSEGFAPPMRYLSALYCFDGQYERALAMADKLRQREPDFSLGRLKDDGYPSHSLRRAGLLQALPSSEL